MSVETAKTIGRATSPMYHYLTKDGEVKYLDCPRWDQ